MKPIEKVLDRLEGVRQSNDSYKALCPAHDDREPSLSISEGEESKAILNCFAGCKTEDIVAELGLQMKDLFERNGKGDRKKFASTPPNNAATVQQCTLEAYSEAKGLPVEFLKKLGLTDRRYQGKEALRIPYLDEGGEEKAVRFRLALESSEEADERFKWRTGSKTALYGLWKLEKIRKTRRVVLAEGESDTQTLWYHGIPALGIPGAKTWKPEWAEYLEGCEKVYAVIEPDEGGEHLREKLAATAAIQERLYFVELAEKDTNSLYLADRDNFKENFTSALKEATPFREYQRQKTKAAAREAYSACKDLVLVPNILDAFANELAASGVAGEEKLAKLLYLALVSRLLEKPVSVAMKGPSAGGKSYLTERVLSFFPESAYYALTAMSEHALAYSEEPLSHRFLVIY